MSESGWSEALVTGSPEIDKQHKEFFAAVDRFAESGLSRESANELLEFLEEHARDHFGLEESYMTVYLYPQAKPHIAAHRAITKKLQDARDRFEAEGVNDKVAVDITNVVNVWLKEQIVSHDRSFIEFLRARKL